MYTTHTHTIIYHTTAYCRVEQVTGALVNEMLSDVLFGSEEIMSEQVDAALWQMMHLTEGFNTLLQSYIGIYSLNVLHQPQQLNMLK